MRMKIAVDFDGTMVAHEYPEIGAESPGCSEWLQKIAEAGGAIILYTMRSGKELQDAIDWTAEHNIPLWGVNRDPDQDSWTDSPKCYANVYVDDAALGCPLRENPKMGGRPMVDWDIVGPALMKILGKQA